MALQVRNNNTNIPFTVAGEGVSEHNATISQDAGRTTSLVFGTVMAKIAATGLYEPLTTVTATDGTAIPTAIYVGPDIDAADLVAGNVIDVPMLVGRSVVVDRSQVVLENSLTLDTVITIGTYDIRTVEDHLRNTGIFMQNVVDVTAFENT
jgi:hypothetical protein